MALPAQLQQQIDAAKAMQEKLTGKPEAESGGDVAVAEAPEAQAPETPAAPAAEQQPVVQPVRNTDTPAGEDENSQTYAQRWKTLQGVYNSTKQQLQDSASRIANLEQLVMSMQTATPRNQAPEPQAAKYVTESDTTEYGTDMVDFARRVAKEEMVPVLRAIRELQGQIGSLQNLAPQVQRVAVNQQATAEEMFFEKLSASVKDWAEINDDPRFHQWLLTPDAMTGLQRQTYLADAQRNLDLSRVVSIFQAWKREAGVPNAPTAAAAAPTKPSAASALEKQIAPGRASAGSAPPAQKQEKTYSRADISQFYADKMQGKYKNRQAEADALERDIFKAQRDGRITG